MLLDMYICKYCGREFESRFKLSAHIGWCKGNPNAKNKCNFNSKSGKEKMKLFNERQEVFKQFSEKTIQNEEAINNQGGSN